jgi:hypothetical protein
MTRIGGLQEESAHMSHIMTPPKTWIFTLNSCPSMFVNYSLQWPSEDDEKRKEKLHTSKKSDRSHSSYIISVSSSYISK